MTLLLPALEIPPGLVFNARKFEIANFQQISPGGRGFIQTIQRGEPAWMAEYSTPPLRAERYDEAITFFDKLEGAVRTFLAWDPRRIMPRAYQHLPVTADPWTQTGEVAPRVTAASYVNSTLTLDRLENGAVISAGDYISLKHGNIWFLFRVTNTTTAASNSAIVEVKPRPNFTGSIGVLPLPIRYRRAVAEMKIIGKVDEEDSMESNPSFSFRAVQFYDRSTE